MSPCVIVGLGGLSHDGMLNCFRPDMILQYSDGDSVVLYTVQYGKSSTINTQEIYSKTGIYTVKLGHIR